MDVIERKTLICPECSAELGPVIFPDGRTVREGCLLYRHGPKVGCPHSNERVTLRIDGPLEVKHFAYEDWSRLPMTLRETRADNSERVR